MQLEGSKATISELEASIGDLKRTNADLKRQMEKWQNLENKSDAEVEEERKRRMELEVEAKQLEDRVAELEEELEGSRGSESKLLEKERKKVAKLKEENDRMAVSTVSAIYYLFSSCLTQEVAEGAQAIAKKAQDDYADLEKQLSKAQKLIEKLQRDAVRVRGGRCTLFSCH